MSLVVPNLSDVLMLQYIVNMIAQDGGAAPVGGERLLHLFTNNQTPGKTTVIGDFTEATGVPGYNAITLVGSNWTTTTSGGANSAVYSQETFSFTTGVSVYGYYVTDLSGNLLWAERFSTAPYVLPPAGGQISISPTISLN